MSAITRRTSGRLASRRALTGALVGAAALALVACSGTTAPEPGTDVEPGGAASTQSVTLVVHDSFPGDEFAEAASEATGYNVKVVVSGDTGELATQLALTADAPIADAFYGVDNLYVSRLVSAEAVQALGADAALPDGVAAHAYDERNSVVPVDYGATCINIDTEWFADADLDAPSTFEDLADPAYRDLTVVIDPTSSSTGGTFLLGTIAHFGENGFADYWKSLVDNGAVIADGWTAGYSGQFTQGGEGGTKPIALSYSTSPAWTLNDDGTESTTAILPDTCSQHVEYAGVLSGAKNQKGAHAVVEYLLSDEFQNTIAESMYMYPVVEGAAVPEEWTTFAQIPENGGLGLPADEVGESRDEWLKQWSEAVGY